MVPCKITATAEEASVTLGAGFHHSEIMFLALARAREEGRGGWESRVGGSKVQ